MLLRRFDQHVKSQNWVAVFLDFAVVVAGVFLGIQLGNWNEVRQVKTSYVQAKTRMVSEHKANIDVVDEFLTSADARLILTRDAIEVLRNCETGVEAQKLLTSGVNAIRGTGTVRFRQTALKAMTENNDFLSLMAEADREDIKEFERYLNQVQSTLNWLENRPFENHIESDPNIGHGELTTFSADEHAMIRPLTVLKPVSEICQDRNLLSKFYLWERTATFQTYRARQIKQQISQRLDSPSDE